MSRVEKELSCAGGSAVTAFAAELRRVRAATWHRLWSEALSQGQGVTV